MLLSIIVPVYNVEKYVLKCIKSILSQNRDDIEIIIVDDGSTDNSLNLINNITKNINNVRIYKKSNGGLSSARNFGLDKSKGKYIWFIDSDDFIEENIIDNILYIISEKKSNIICGDYKIYNDINYEIKEINSKYYGYTEMLQAIDSIKNPLCNVWRYVVLKDFLLNNNISFVEGVLCEDIEWTTKLFIYGKKIYIMEKSIYNYRSNRSGSIMTLKNNTILSDMIFNINKSFYLIVKSDIKFINKVYIFMNLCKQYIFAIYNWNFLSKGDRKKVINDFSGNIIIRCGKKIIYIIAAKTIYILKNIVDYFK